VLRNRVRRLGSDRQRWEYDPATDNWKALAPLPTKARSPVAVTVGDKMYVIGGATTLPGSTVVHPARPHYSVGAVEEYDPATNTWRARAPIPTPAITPRPACERKVYVIGGRVGGAFVSSGAQTSASSRNTIRRQTHGRASRAHAFGAKRDSSGAWGGKIYVTGGEGQDYVNMFAFRALERMTGCEQLAVLPNMPVGRHGLAGAVVGNRLHMVSGDVQSLHRSARPHRVARRLRVRRGKK